MKKTMCFLVSHCTLIVLIFSAICGMVGCSDSNRKSALISVLQNSFTMDCECTMANGDTVSVSYRHTPENTDEMVFTEEPLSGITLQYQGENRELAVKDYQLTLPIGNGVGTLFSLLSRPLPELTETAADTFLLDTWQIIVNDNGLPREFISSDGMTVRVKGFYTESTLS